MLVILAPGFKLQSLPLRSNPPVRTHPGWLECLCKLGLSVQSRRGIALAAGCCMCQYTYSEGQTCFAWQCQVNSRIAVRFSDCSPSEVSCDRDSPSRDIDLRFRFECISFPTAFLMASTRMLILDAVPAHRSGDDRLHSAHSHRPGLHHWPEVQYSSCIDCRRSIYSNEWKDVEVEFIRIKGGYLCRWFPSWGLKLSKGLQDFLTR